MEDLSAIVILQQILSDATTAHCTDVHLHSSQDELLVNFRVDGQIRHYARIPEQGQSVIRRLKVLARMDVAESRFPQDGSFHWENESVQCDIRVAAVPTVDGEAVVLRLLSQQREPIDFTTLGMTDGEARMLNEVLASGTGLILVAGPTGSGKTTTLYAMMVQLARWGRRVISIEDPVEMSLDDCQQIEVRERSGVTFEVGLKAILRQDPDAIMIGEIRDEQTAKVALRAAVSGHLVLSTTHAADLVSAAARLTEFGASRALIGDVLKAVIVQRLVTCDTCTPKICATCRMYGSPNPRRIQFDLKRMTPAIAQLFASSLNWVDLRSQVNAL